jgi:hypothetical protein
MSSLLYDHLVCTEAEGDLGLEDLFTSIFATKDELRVLANTAGISSLYEAKQYVRTGTSALQ